MTDTLAKTVDRFLESRYRRDDDTGKAARNLLKGRSSFAFLKQSAIINLLNRPVTDRDVIECIPAAVKESVTSYPRDHNTAIEIYKKYLNFVREKYAVSVHVDFPPTFNSQFDRQMYIVKSLHAGDKTSEQLADELWVSERTIREDLRQLDEGINVLGQRLAVSRSTVLRNRRMKNTIHPIFLSANLTQVVVLLRGLEMQARDPAYREYAERLARNIWNELSDYARTRIKYVSRMLNLNTAWFEMLDEKGLFNLYSSEEDCSVEEGLGSVIMFLKNGQRCAIEIETATGTEILENCLVKEWLNNGTIRIEHNGKYRDISEDSVIRARRSGKCMY